MRDSVEDSISKISAIERYVTAISRKFGGGKKRRVRTNELEEENSVEIYESLVQENKVLIQENKVLIVNGFPKGVALNEGQLREIRPSRETAGSRHAANAVLPKSNSPNVSQQREIRQSAESTRTADVTNPVASDDSTMVCGDFRTGASRNLYVKDSESRDESLLVSGHWGASGDVKSVAARSSGRSITIIGSVGVAARAEDAYESLQQKKRSPIV